MGEGRLARFAVVGLVLLFGLQFRAIYAVDFLLTNDGPQHLLTAFVHRFYHSSPLRFDETWIINEPLTDHGYKEVFGLLVTWFPWRLADRIAFHAPVLVASAGWLLVARWRGGQWQVRGLLLLGLSITWNYWIGFLPFAYASAFSPWILLVFLTSSLERPFHLFIFAALLLLQAHCHPFPAMVIGGLVFGTSVARRDLKGVLRVIVGGLPAAALALYVAHLSTVAIKGGVWEFDRNPFNAYFACYVPGPLAFRVALGGFLVLLAVVSVRRWRGLSPVSRCGLALAALALLVSPLLPIRWGTWDLVGPRTLVTLAPMLIALSGDFAMRLAPALALAFAAFSASYLEWVRFQSVAVESAYSDVFEAAITHLPALPRLDWEFQVLEITPHPKGVEVAVPYLSPALHIPQALAVEKGGRPIYTQSDDRVLHGLLRQDLPWRHIGQEDIHPAGLWASFWGQLQDDPERRHVHMAAHFSRMAHHDVLFVIGFDDDAIGMERAGYKVTYLGKSERGLAILRGDFEGCTVALEIVAAFADVVEIGLIPEDKPIEAVPVDAGRTDLWLDRLPCGRWWIRTEQRLTPSGPPYVVVDVQREDQIEAVQYLETDEVRTDRVDESEEARPP